MVELFNGYIVFRLVVSCIKLSAFVAKIPVAKNYNMSKKNKPDIQGFVYSTDPNFKFQQADEAAITLPPQQQKLRLRLETKHRGGKAATLVAGFIGTDEDLQNLGKKLKNICGTGGSAKDSEIIIQGDQRPKVLKWLLENGYKQSK